MLASPSQSPYREGMGTNRTELTALKNLLSQADRILETSPTLPENRTGACRELLQAALSLTDDLIKNAPTPAALMGSKGGSGFFILNAD